VRRVGRRTLVRYQLGRTDGHRLLKAVALMGRVLLAAGAREIVTGVPGARPVGDVAQLDAVVADADPRRLHLSAFHPTGTARIGGDAELSPVDADGRLRGIEGVWVADGAAVPTCPEVNPQITIMALALGVADRVLST
jgi:choline dehydrogenase-like flavoprotein